MDELKAYVTNVEDPLWFWACCGYDEDLRAESHMKELIGEYVEKNSHLTDIDDLVLTQNQVIIARSSEYNCWLRATVVADVSSCSCAEVDVVFTDYGSNEFVTWRDIIVTVPDYVLNWSRSAECFELNGIQPCGDNWSDEAINRFASLVKGKTLPCRRIPSISPDAADSLIVYSSEDRLKTIQGLLVDGGFAKWLTDDKGNSKQMVSYAFPFSTVSSPAVKKSGQIPEFNAQSLFLQNNSPSPPPPLPPSELPQRDYEIEERRKHLSSSTYEFPARTDDTYLGLRLPRPSEIEDFDEKIDTIKGEIARASGQQLVRPNNGYLPRSYAQSPNLSQRDWRSRNSPQDSPRLQRMSPLVKKQNDKSACFDQMSFKLSLQELLNQSSNRVTICNYLKPFLVEDTLQHNCLFVSISTIVDHHLKNGNNSCLNFKVLESLKEMNGFSYCLENLIQQIDNANLQIARTPSKEIKAKLKPFAEFLAQLIVKFDKMPDVFGRVFSIADSWMQRCTEVAVTSPLCTACATCLKNFVCSLEFLSLNLFKEKIESLMTVAREELLSDHASRSVKEILLEMILDVERKKSKEELMKEIISQDSLPLNLSCADSVHNGSVSTSPSNSVEFLTPSGSDSARDRDVNTDPTEARKPPRNNSEDAIDAKTTPGRKNRRRSKNKMSLSQYHAAIPDAPAQSSGEASNGRNSAQSCDGFAMSQICVLCGAQGDHDSSGCPHHRDNFIL